MSGPHAGDAHGLLLRLIGGEVVWDTDIAAGRGPAALLRHAGRREVALLRARTTGLGRRVAVRTAPPVTRAGASARGRRWLAGGAVVATRDPSARPLDAVLGAAGFDVPAGGPTTLLSRGLRVGSGGTVLLLGTAAGRPAVLRVAAADSAADPRPTARTLRALAAADVTRVPEALGEGVVHGLAWSLESRLPGAAATGLDDALLDDVADFCATLPPWPGSALVPALADTARGLLPALADDCLAVEEAIGRHAVRLPAVTTHGDLWTGNLLVLDGRLSGVVDWDGARPAAVPGADVLHAVATADRMRHRRSLGAELLARPWAQGPTADALGRAWERSGLRLSDSDRDVVVLAWWAHVVTSALARSPGLARDPRWADENVAAVLRHWRTTLPGAAAG